MVRSSRIILAVVGLLVSVAVSKTLAQDVYKEEIIFTNHIEPFVQAATPLPDGSIIACGTFAPPSSIGFIMKIDTSGGVRWMKRLDCPANISFLSLLARSDGSLIIAGESLQREQPLSGAPVLFCIGPGGEFRWGKHYGFKKGATLNTIISLSDGGFFMVGEKTDSVYTNASNFFCLKLDSAASIVWCNISDTAIGQFYTTYATAIEHPKTHTPVIIGEMMWLDDSTIPARPNGLSVVQLDSLGKATDSHAFLLDGKTIAGNVFPISVLSRDTSHFIIGARLQDVRMGRESPLLIDIDQQLHVNWASNYLFIPGLQGDELLGFHLLTNKAVIGLTREVDSQLCHLFMTDVNGALLSAAAFDATLNYGTVSAPFPSFNGSLMIFNTNYGFLDTTLISVATTTPEFKGCNMQARLGTTTPVKLTDTVLPFVVYPTEVNATPYSVNITNDVPKVFLRCTTSEVEQKDHILDEPSITLSPNPALKQRVVSAIVTNVSGAFDVIISDERGVELYRSHQPHNTEHRFELPTGNLSVGAYVVSIVDRSSRTIITTSKIFIY